MTRLSGSDEEQCERQEAGESSRMLLLAESDCTANSVSMMIGPCARGRE